MVIQAQMCFLLLNLLIFSDILVISGSLDLKETWRTELDNTSSPLYLSTVDNFTSEVRTFNISISFTISK